MTLGVPNIEGSAITDISINAIAREITGRKKRTTRARTLALGMRWKIEIFGIGTSPDLSCVRKRCYETRGVKRSNAKTLYLLLRQVKVFQSRKVDLSALIVCGRRIRVRGAVRMNQASRRQTARCRGRFEFSKAGSSMKCAVVSEIFPLVLTTSTTVKVLIAEREELHVEVLHIEGVVFNELSTRLDAVTH